MIAILAAVNARGAESEVESLGDVYAVDLGAEVHAVASSQQLIDTHQRLEVDELLNAQVKMHHLRSVDHSGASAHKSAHSQHKHSAHSAHSAHSPHSAPHHSAPNHSPSSSAQELQSAQMAATQSTRLNPSLRSEMNPDDMDYMNLSDEEIEWLYHNEEFAEAMWGDMEEERSDLEIQSSWDPMAAYQLVQLEMEQERIKEEFARLARLELLEDFVGDRVVSATDIFEYIDANEAAIVEKYDVVLGAYLESVGITSDEELLDLIMNTDMGHFKQLIQDKVSGMTESEKIEYISTRFDYVIYISYKLMNLLSDKYQEMVKADIEAAILKLSEEKKEFFENLGGFNDSTDLDNISAEVVDKANALVDQWEKVMWYTYFSVLETVYGKVGAEAKQEWLENNNPEEPATEAPVLPLYPDSSYFAQEDWFATENCDAYVTVSWMPNSVEDWKNCCDSYHTYVILNSKNCDNHYRPDDPCFDVMDVPTSASMYAAVPNPEWDTCCVNNADSYYCKGNEANAAVTEEPALPPGKHVEDGAEFNLGLAIGIPVGCVVAGLVATLIFRGKIKKSIEERKSNKAQKVLDIENMRNRFVEFGELPSVRNGRTGVPTGGSMPATDGSSTTIDQSAFSKNSTYVTSSSDDLIQ